VMDRPEMDDILFGENDAMSLSDMLTLVDWEKVSIIYGPQDHT
jgi:hypothetical protein